jgi:8-oxo-dGTP pyrophosphatase MutT (NUDIX family)
MLRMDDGWNWDDVRRRLQAGATHDLSARERLMPYDEAGAPARPVDAPPGVTPRIGAVLVLLYPAGSELFVPLTVRNVSLRTHSGEISLPGGSFDAADETLARTALREAWEEIGVEPLTVEIVTDLTPVWIPVSNFRITPIVGLTNARPQFMPAPAEVAAVVEAPLNRLADPSLVRSELRELRGRMVHVPYFALDEHKVWGATALILAQLIGRLRD